MKSGKQRRAEIAAKRKKRSAKSEPEPSAAAPRPYGTVPVNGDLLAPNNSYGAPDFVGRGYYIDRPFRCVDCNKEEVWTAAQQKWWYEVAKGFIYSSAVRCRACRRKKRKRRDEARRIHLQGLVKKKLRESR